MVPWRAARRHAVHLLLAAPCLTPRRLPFHDPLCRLWAAISCGRLQIRIETAGGHHVSRHSKRRNASVAACRLSSAAVGMSSARRLRQTTAFRIMDVTDVTDVTAFRITAPWETAGSQLARAHMGVRCSVVAAAARWGVAYGTTRPNDRRARMRSGATSTEGVSRRAARFGALLLHVAKICGV